MRQFTIHHDGVTIAVSRGGSGRPLVLCPGLSSTQADLHELTELLRRDYEVTTFDLRGHGLASAADNYSFDAFRSDLAAVLAELDPPEPPTLVGYSLGADLALHHTRDHPDTIANLILIDGANPLPEPIITDTDLEQFRAMWEAQATDPEVVRARGTAHQVLLTGQHILDLNLELDAIRTETTLDLYRKLTCPISMIMSTTMAGDSEDLATRINRIWRAGIDHLTANQPHIAVSWLQADHGLVFTHAPDIAAIIRGTERRRFSEAESC